MAVFGGMMLSIVEVDAQSTVDDSVSCESSTLNEAVDLIKQGIKNDGLIRENLKAVNLIRKDLEDVKNLLGLYQPQNSTSIISKKDLEDLKAACVSNQQQSPKTELSKQALVSSLLREYRTCIMHF